MSDMGKVIALIDREEAFNFIAKQLKGETPAGDYRSKGNQWHYGRMELKELLDAIYGETLWEKETG